MSKKFCYIFLIFVSLFSCSKTNKENYTNSSIKLLPCKYLFSSMQMATADNGNILVCANGAWPSIYFSALSAPQQVFNYIKPNGDLIKSFHLVDSSYDFVNIIKGIDGGFFITMAHESGNQINCFKLDDECNMILFNVINVTKPIGIRPQLSLNSNNKYSFFYGTYSTGYYNSVFMEINQDATVTSPVKTISQPFIKFNNILYNNGFHNFLIQPDLNNSLKYVVAGNIFGGSLTNHKHNVFCNGLNKNFLKNYYSSEFDSVLNEYITGLFYTLDKKIIIFGVKYEQETGSGTREGYGFPFARIYNDSLRLEHEIDFPEINNSPTLIEKLILSPDSGYLFIGNNNYNPSITNLYDQKTNLAIMKINKDYTVGWQKSYNLSNTAWGLTATYLKDGSIGVASIKNNEPSSSGEKNKMIYMHLDANGNYY